VKPSLWRGLTPSAQRYGPHSSSGAFTSPRHVFTNRFTQLFTVPLTGGMPTQLPIPHAADACFSSDDAFIVYTPLGDRSQQWKHYRGGTTSCLWIYNRTNHVVVQVPQPDGRCNDVRPCWLGDTIYFLSDRAGEYNLFAYHVPSKKVRQLTHHDDSPVVSLAAGGEHLIYEQAGYLHRFEPSKEKATRLKIGVASDLVEARPRYARGAKHIRNAALSPSAARAVFEFRGEIEIEIVTVPMWSSGRPT
jgi:tricorn protease